MAASLSDRTRLAELEGALEQERTKVKQLEGEVVSHSMVKEGLSSELRKVGLEIRWRNNVCACACVCARVCIHMPSWDIRIYVYVPY